MPLKGLIIERFTTATRTPSRKFQLPTEAEAAGGATPPICTENQFIHSISPFL